MPKFAANLSMMFQDLGFLDRFDAAARAGFKGIEFLFPYDHTPEEVAGRLERNGLSLALFNTVPGDWAGGERGLAAQPGREQEFRDGVDKAIIYAKATKCPLLHAMAGLWPGRYPRVVGAGLAPVRRGVRALHVLHRAHVGDYVSWVLIGFTVLGVTLLLG